MAEEGTLTASREWQTHDRQGCGPPRRRLMPASEALDCPGSLEGGGEEGVEIGETTWGAVESTIHKPGWRSSPRALRTAGLEGKLGTRMSAAPALADTDARLSIIGGGTNMGESVDWGWGVSSEIPS